MSIHMIPDSFSLFKPIFKIFVSVALQRFAVCDPLVGFVNCGLKPTWDMQFHHLSHAPGELKTTPSVPLPKNTPSAFAAILLGAVQPKQLEQGEVFYALSRLFHFFSNTDLDAAHSCMPHSRHQTW